MANNILNQIKRLPIKEKRSYLTIAVLVVIIVSVFSYGPITTLLGRSGTKLQAWCSDAKDNMKHYTTSGLTCGLYRDGKLVSLADADGKYTSVFCELGCYECGVETSARAKEVCAAGAQYAIGPYGTPAIDTKTDDPMYGQTDGDDSFVLSWDSAPSTAYRNEEVRIVIKIKNADMTRGKMKVQCSILDPKVHTWMGAVTAIKTSNCVRGESYTETQIVEIGAGETGKLTFTPTAPNEVGKYRYFCEAFERCYEKGIDSGVSSTLKDRYIDIKERPATLPVVNPDSGTKDTSGDAKSETTWDWKMENPFDDISAWWSKKNTMQKFVIGFGSLFAVLFLFLFFQEQKAARAAG